MVEVDAIPGPRAPPVPPLAAMLRGRPTMKFTDLAISNLRFVARGGAFLPAGHIPPSGHRVPDTFIGICVASSPDPACDEYVINRLREMGIRHVRLDYTYGSDDRHTARFLDRLLDESFIVLLHLVQPFEEARAIETEASQRCWRAFVGQTLDRWGGRIEAVEIGSTVNRRKWSGYSAVPAFMRAWRIAHEEARSRSVKLAGPNVTDFEPLYNVALLAGMRSEGLLPDIHTDNLFAERTCEPELYDRRILGQRMAPVIKYTLVKKARLLSKIAELYGVPETWSTHAAWSKRRINRVLPNVEDKQADYLVRYLILTAASAGLTRAYWGPLIGQREGVVDDGTDEYPTPIPHVTLYELACGDVARYRVRPAGRAMCALTERLPGSRYEGRADCGFGLESHVFTRGDAVIHAHWTIDGRAAEPASLYEPQDLGAGEWFDRDGRRLDGPPSLLTESPCYVHWPRDRPPRLRSGARPIPNFAIHRPVELYEQNGWRGAVNAETDEERRTLLEAISPDRIDHVERQAVLRDARNTVWRIADPRGGDGSLVVKRALLTKWHKRIMDRRKPSKARRSWNGACELARRGIETPRPIAFFERAERAALRESYYICEFTPGGLSVRSFFTAYAAGQESYEGVPADEFYRRLSAFLFDMHRRRVFFRDLSAGNILVRKLAGGDIAFSLIDTGRARFLNRGMSMAHRLSDLKRICHPLHWEGRKTFVGMYLEVRNEPFTLRRRLPFVLYDLKHRLKRPLKRLRKGKRRVARRIPASGAH